MPVIEKRNILFCLFDSLSAADSGLTEVTECLPVLSNLCENSAYFSRTYAPSPQSSPARASVFTGLDPCVHGLWTNGVILPEKETTFVQRLTQAGYSSYLAGRYQLAGVSQWTTEQMRQGEFDQTDWAHGPLHRSRQNAYLIWLQKNTPELYAKIFTSQADPANTALGQHEKTAIEALPDKLSFNHWVGERVGDWIDSQPIDKPFVAIAGFSVGDMLGTEPHPETDGEGLNSSALLQAYSAIGRLLDQLSASNRAQDTVVIVTSARGTTNSVKGHHALSDSAVRVPLLIHGAGLATQRNDVTISTMDIAPTVMELANVPNGLRVQGQSLLGVLDGSVKPRGWALSRLRASSPSGIRNWQTALHTNSMKLVVCHGDQQEAQEKMVLYKLDTDPAEQENLAGLAKHASELEQMIDQMIDARCALEDRTEPRIAEF